MDRKLISNNFDDWLIILVFFFFFFKKGICQTFPISSFSSMKICCFSLFYIIINWISLSFWLLVGQNKTFKDFIDRHFFAIIWHFNPEKNLRIISCRTKFHSNPSNSCWDISVSTTAVHRQTDIRRATLLARLKTNSSALSGGDAVSKLFQT